MERREIGERGRVNIQTINEDVQDEGLKKIDISEWERKERQRNKEDRIDVYYYPPGDRTRLRSQNEVKRYCERNKLEYDPKYFTFKAGKVNQKNVEGNEGEYNLNSEDMLNDIFQKEVYSAEIPRNFEESQEHPEKERWIRAMEEEIKIMRERKVWTLVDLPEKQRVIGNRWVYTIKRDDQNNIKGYKARLVAQGFNQR